MDMDLNMLKRNMYFFFIFANLQVTMSTDPCIYKVKHCDLKRRNLKSLQILKEQAVRPSTIGILLNGNKLTRIEEISFLHVPRITFISLDENEIYFVSDKAFFGLTRLRNLYLSHNKLDCIPNLSLTQKSLRVFHMNNNFLSRCSDDYYLKNKVTFPRLHSVQLDDNNLSIIPKFLLGAVRLKSLSLKHNMLKTVPYLTMIFSKLIQWAVFDSSIRLAGNPITCTASNAWIKKRDRRKILLGKGLRFTSFALENTGHICPNGSELAGQPWDRLSVEELQMCQLRLTTKGISLIPS